jgi:hypothetical protein
MSSHLPVQEIQRLLDDHRLLLVERRQLEKLLAELEPEFRSVRSVLNRLHRLLTSTTGPGADDAA